MPELSMGEIMSLGPVIPVMVIENVEDAVPMAQALVNGGLKVLEVTLRTGCALIAAKKIKQAVPEAIVGIGTIITPADLENAISSGADFLVSPGSTPALMASAINQAIPQGIPVLPGVATPSEAMTMLEMGFTHMKFFPAEAAGGITMLNSIQGPLPQIKFCPTGGISEKLARQYLALDNVVCVGGSWLITKKSIQTRNWAEVESCARGAMTL